MSRARCAAQVDAAGERLEHSDDALEQRRLAGAVRADHGHQRALLHRAVQMMHRRVAVIAERQVSELECRAHAIAQNTAPHSTAITTATAASRSGAERRRIDGDTVAGGCAWPG
jgi:hypothetical protein